jgi:hypothetical protein
MPFVDREGQLAGQSSKRWQWPSNSLRNIQVAEGMDARTEIRESAILPALSQSAPDFGLQNGSAGLDWSGSRGAGGDSASM